MNWQDISDDITHGELIPTLNTLFRMLLGIDEEGTGSGQTVAELRTEILTIIDTLRVYDQAGFFEGKPASDAILYRYITCRRINIPSDFSGSIAKCVIAPTGNYIIKIMRGEDEIGTITFPAGTSTGIFASLGAFTLDVGDTLTFKAPSTEDNTFETLIFNLKLLWSE